MATPEAYYIFLRWSVTGGLSVANEYNAATTLFVGGSGTIEPLFTASYEQVDFFLVGVGGDATGTVFTLDSNNRDGAAFNFTLSLEAGSVHPFAWSSSVSGGTGTRYVWTSSSGLSEAQSGSISIPSGPGSLSAFYQTQYFATITAGACGTVDVTSGWHDASSAIALTATPNPGYAFLSWITTGGISASDPGSATTTLTINGPGSVEASFQVLPLDISFSQMGIETDYSGAVVSVDGMQILRANLTKTFSWAAGSSHNFAWLSPLVVSAEKQYVWAATSGLSSAQSDPITISVMGSVEGSYKAQFYVTIGAGSGGNVDRGTGWYDASSPLTITATPNPQYGFKSWVTTGNVSVSDLYSPTTSLTATGAGTIQATFERLPVMVSFSQSGIGADFSGEVLFVDGVALLRSQLTMNYSWSVGDSHAFSWLSPLTVSAEKRYVWSSSSGLSIFQSGAIAIPVGGGTLNGNYKVQYNVAISAGTGGTVDKAGGWFDASMPVAVSAAPSAGYAFKSWVVTGGISVSNLNSAVATMTVTGTGTLQATFELLPVGVTFTQSGIGADFTGVALEVDGVPVQLSELMKTYSWVIGSTHTFSWLSPLTASADSRYVWVSTTGLSAVQEDSVIAPSGFGYIGGEYKAQYFITIVSGVGGSVNASSGWRDGFSIVHVTATPGMGYCFKMWVTTGNITLSDPYSPTAMVTVAGAGSVNASFEVLPVDVSFVQSGIGTGYVGAVLEVDGAAVQLSELSKVYSWEVGSSHTFSWLSPLTMSAEKRYVWVAASGISSLQSGSIITPSVAGSLVGSYAVQYYVTVETATGGTTSLPTASWYASNMAGFVSAIPSSGYQFANWTTTGSVSVTNSSAIATTFTVTGPGTIKANFIYVPDAVTVTIKSSMGGSTSPSGIDNHELGSTVEITATPSFGYEFMGWTLEGNATLADPASPSTTLTVGGEAIVTANFHLLGNPSYEVIFQSSTGGTISPSGNGSYPKGASVSIAASPLPGYRFLGWSVEGDATVTDASSASTVLTINGQATVTPSFELVENQEFTVIFLANEGGSVSPSGTISYTGVTEIDITAIPEDGHLFSTWNVTGDVEIANSTSASTTIMVYGHGTVTALFYPGDPALSIVDELCPANGSTVNEGPVKIRASFSDWAEIDPSMVVLKVDGVEVSGAEVTSSGIAYDAMLESGAHTVELTAEDILGNTRTVTWELVASSPFTMSWELYAAIVAEIVVAGLIVFLWWRGRSPLARVSKPVKKPVVH